jgi:hypothetical protein
MFTWTHIIHVALYKIAHQLRMDFYHTRCFLYTKRGYIKYMCLMDWGYSSGRRPWVQFPALQKKKM